MQLRPSSGEAVGDVKSTIEEKAGGGESGITAFEVTGRGCGGGLTGGLSCTINGTSSCPLHIRTYSLLHQLTVRLGDAADRETIKGFVAVCAVAFTRIASFPGLCGWGRRSGCGHG